MAKSKKSKKQSPLDFEEFEELMVARMHQSIISVISSYFMGITPEDYSKICQLLDKSPFIQKCRVDSIAMADLMDSMTGEMNLEKFNKETGGIFMEVAKIIDKGNLFDFDDTDDVADAPFVGSPIKKFEAIDDDWDDDYYEKTDDEYVEIYGKGPMADAARKTLKLKIKAKDITKPPIWREIELPAVASFYELHDVIQISFGFENYHLWVFQKKAYNSPFAIREDDFEDDFSLMDIISPAVPVSSFLAAKGDKLEYVYDFGDDWIFEIAVVDVIDKESKYPVVTKAKGDNFIEDIGGSWGYMQRRDAYNRADELTDEQKREVLDFTGFDSFDEFIDLMNDKKFNIYEVNEELKSRFN